MKLIFFVIGFSLIFLRVYFKSSGVFGHHGRTTSITVSNGSDYMQIKYSGTITLNDNETGFQQISPGGYVRFRQNDKKLLAEGNLKGEISYELSDDGEAITDPAAARQFTAAAIREMIAYGFDAGPRMERIYQAGGVKALLQQLKQFKNGTIGTQYARRILATDSLTTDERNEVIDDISTLLSNPDKVPLLKKINMAQLTDTSTVDHYFRAIENLGADVDKINVLDHLLKSDRLTTLVIDKIQGVADRFGAEPDRQHIYRQLQAFQ